MNFKTILFTFLITLVFAGCENEIDINAPYKEIPYVYGLLDPNDPVQYIRIEKIYQNSVDQTTQQGAQYPDSLYYDSLQVTVKSLTFGIDYHFTKTNEFNKDPGFFTNQGHVIYKSAFKASPYENYELTIHNPLSGNTYKAVTAIVEPMTVDEGAFSIRPHFNYSFMIYRILKLGERAVYHDSYFFFRYQEYPASDPTDIDTVVVEYTIKKEEEVGSNLTIAKLVASSDFVNHLKFRIANKPGYIRKFIDVQKVSISGSAFLKDVIDLSKDNGGFIDKKRDYSNISGGAQGIFSSRATVTKKVKFNDENTTDSSRIYLLKDLPQFVYP